MRPVILIERFAYAPHGVLGRCTVSTAPGLRLWAVEPPWVGNTPYKSCIPEGAYPAHRYTWLQKPGAEWQLEGVPGRTAITFHVGNHQADLAGCIALGTGLGGFWIDGEFLLGVTHSRDAMREFNQALRPAEAALVVVTFTADRPAGANLRALAEGGLQV